MTREPCGAAEPARAPQARVGGRSARVVADVLRVTLELIGEHGFAGLRVEDVAARAGVNKTTIYRRWPTRADLVVAALIELATPPTGDRDRPPRVRPACDPDDVDHAAVDAASAAAWSAPSSTNAETPKSIASSK